MYKSPELLLTLTGARQGWWVGVDGRRCKQQLPVMGKRLMP